MNSFFGDDTAEEDKLIANILKKEKKDAYILPRIIEEIVTSHLVQSVLKQPKGEGVEVKSEVVGTTKEDSEEHLKIIEKYSKEEKLNFNLSVHIFSFHLKKNGRINADLYFIPYKSQNNKDIITEYTYNYGYYDIYSKDIEQVNKSIHLTRLGKKHTLDETTNSKQVEDNEEHTQKKIRIKTEVEYPEQNFKQESIRAEEKIALKKRQRENIEGNNFQKWLVHFRGRLFIGCEIVYSYFNINTFLATIQNRNMQDTSIEGFKMFDKKIQTYNFIKNAIYWKQDVYPDISDQNVQKLLFFLLVPPLNDTENEEEALKDIIVF